MNQFKLMIATAVAVIMSLFSSIASADAIDDGVEAIYHIQDLDTSEALRTASTVLMTEYDDEYHYGIYRMTSEQINAAAEATEASDQVFWGYVWPDASPADNVADDTSATIVAIYYVMYVVYTDYDDMPTAYEWYTALGGKKSLSEFNKASKLH